MMESIFYFTKRNVELDNIREIAQKKSYQIEKYIRPDDEWLNIHYGNDDFWQWSKLSKMDFDGFEKPQQKVINQFQPLSAFEIEYHINSKFELVTLLKLILVNYKGWIGCNDGTFNKIYTLNNLDDFKCPF